jgi:hypothetical protein
MSRTAAAVLGLALLGQGSALWAEDSLVALHADPTVVAVQWVWMSDPPPPPPLGLVPTAVVAAKHIEAGWVRARVIYAKHVDAAAGAIRRVVEEHGGVRWEGAGGKGHFKNDAIEHIRVEGIDADVIYVEHLKADWIDAGEVHAEHVKLGK